MKYDIYLQETRLLTRRAMKPGTFLVGGHPPVVQAGLLVILPEEYIEALTLGILIYIRWRKNVAVRNK